MTTYLLKRIVSMVPVLFLVSIVIFSLIHLTPGDPVITMLGEEATLEARDRLRAQLGLDRPLPVQYAAWLAKVVTGDLGRSIRTNQPVAEAITERLPVTIQLAFLAMAIAMAIALPVGIIAATRRGTFADIGSTVMCLLGVSMPNFLLAVFLVYVFSLTLRWLPPIGYISPVQDLLGNLKGMVMPAVTLGVFAAAATARLTRSSLLEVLGQDYVRTGYAKGLDERAVIRRHAMKNALIPVVTVVGLQLGNLLGSAIVTETIFALPGVGRLVVDSIYQRDFPLVQGVTLYLAVIFLVVNLIVDMIYAYLDPRIRYS
ncbi:MAG TPA: ABC transporter permease [Chloroflexota bacterium]|nr:ABC transporter permease [Chloroflexota bacterium]